MPTDKPRFSLTLSEDVLAQIERYQIEKGYATRNKAMVELVRLGIDALALSDDQKPESPALSNEAAELLPLFEQLDLLDRVRIIGQVEGLLLSEKYQQERKPSAG